MATPKNTAGAQEKRHRATLANEAAYEIDALLRMALTTRFNDGADQQFAMRGVMIRVKDLIHVVIDVQHEKGPGAESITDLEKIVYGETAGTDAEPVGVLMEAANG